MTAVFVDEAVGVGVAPYTAVDVLNLGEQLLKGGECWIKGDLVQNRHELPLMDPEAWNADKWCVMGALFAAAGRLDLREEQWGCLDQALGAVYSVVRRQHISVPAFNDDPGTTWADVQRVFAVARERVGV